MSSRTDLTHAVSRAGDDEDNAAQNAETYRHHRADAKNDDEQRGENHDGRGV